MNLGQTCVNRASTRSREVRENNVERARAAAPLGPMIAVHYLKLKVLQRCR